MGRPQSVPAPIHKCTICHATQCTPISKLPLNKVVSSLVKRRTFTGGQFCGGAWFQAPGLDRGLGQICPPPHSHCVLKRSLLDTSRSTTFFNSWQTKEFWLVPVGFEITDRTTGQPNSKILFEVFFIRLRQSQLTPCLKLCQTQFRYQICFFLDMST